MQSVIHKKSQMQTAVSVIRTIRKAVLTVTIQGKRMNNACAKVSTAYIILVTPKKEAIEKRTFYFNPGCFIDLVNSGQIQGSFDSVTIFQPLC